ncbi:MAG: NAD(P)/FAD-dependent oxidoreductase [Acidimicrobiales bacterium]
MNVSAGSWNLPSFWLSQLDLSSRRASLRRSGSVDVAVVGAGFSGLWTAYFLQELDPTLSIAVVEREFAGFGASGRNGGWVSPYFSVSWNQLQEVFGEETTQRFAREMLGVVDELGARVSELDISCHYTKAGSISFMRNQSHVNRAMNEFSELQRRGIGEEVRLLGAREADDVLKVSYAHGASFTSQCATVDPGRLVRELADAVEARGAVIYESSPVTKVREGSLEVGSTRLSASSVVVATEGYTSELDPWRRQLLPLYSMMVVTEPLSDREYEAVGSPTPGLCFADYRHLVIYGQITHDRRIAFGGRGAPYHAGSRVNRSFDTHGPTRAALQRELVALMPVLRNVRFVRHWGGPLGVARDWQPRVLHEPGSSLWRLGGYAGDGVSTSLLAGKVTAKAVLGRSDESAAAVVFRRPPRAWEPEPLRWLGVNAGLTLTKLVDVMEDRGVASRGLECIWQTLIGQA